MKLGKWVPRRWGSGDTMYLDVDLTMILSCAWKDGGYSVTALGRKLGNFRYRDEAQQAAIESARKQLKIVMELLSRFPDPNRKCTLPLFGWECSRGFGHEGPCAATQTMPTFKNAICRGSIILGSACGHCERCDWEQSNLRQRRAAEI